MGEVKWTKEQALAINEKGENILVAAGAGSGKTAVLIERIMNKILNEKIDIDKILVVTFTKAAASEMRERLLKSLYKEIEKNPDDSYLQRQTMLLSKANICTIDSFCLDVVKNNFFETGISPNFKIADSTEIQILKLETLEELFDEKYEANEKDFMKLVNMFTSYKEDEELKGIILSIYDFIQSTPYPKKWIEEKVEAFKTEQISFEETALGAILFNKAKDEIENGILNLKESLESIKYEEDTEKIVVILTEDIRKITELGDAKTWDELYDRVENLSLDKFSSSKAVPDEIKDKIKNKRQKVKESIKAINNKILLMKTEDAHQETKQMYEILIKIKNITLEFIEKFTKVKQDKNMMYFDDIAHAALEILTKEESNVSDKYKEKYEEIMIDEYQDSNLVQETILTSISRGNNMFMVGDVKQSIYKFRKARPELFLEKYDTYKNKEDLEEGDSLKIQLFKNFRSRKNILDITNILFNNIMSKELGDIDYTEDEYLNLGADYEKGENLNTELHIIDLKEEEESIYKGEEKEEEPEERIEDVVLEAKFVANKIKELLDNKFQVLTKDREKRDIQYKDIAILLRSTKANAPIYEQEISKLNLPVFCDIASRIFRFS